MEQKLLRLRDGRTLSYFLIGNQQNRPIVYLHGFGSSSPIMFEMEEELTRRNLYLIAPDRPGYGKSSLFSGYDLHDYAKDLLELADSLKLSAFSIAGWSTGGLFAQAFANRYPSKIRSLTLIGSTLPIGLKRVKSILPISWKCVNWLIEKAPAFSSKAAKLISRWIARKLKKRLSLSVSDASGHPIPPASEVKELLNQAVKDVSRLKGRHLYDELSAVCSAVLEYPEDSYFPVTIWQGEKDLFSTHAASSFLKNEYKRANLFLIPHKGHFMILDHRIKILDHLEEGMNRFGRLTKKKSRVD
ncbi:alpha/beta fold hydrolase [Peribacillus kribbensis]|uniref:alpha/beta fold hydrolase n=1 Tax=Peribacillus kribbensis TaxID=356658 RepID=UPI0003FBF521|nr:alpha/beta hydrolase [Peribacillus kribbensis]